MFYRLFNSLFFFFFPLVCFSVSSFNYLNEYSLHHLYDIINHPFIHRISLTNFLLYLISRLVIRYLSITITIPKHVCIPKHSSVLYSVILYILYLVLPETCICSTGSKVAEDKFSIHLFLVSITGYLLCEYNKRGKRVIVSRMRANRCPTLVPQTPYKSLLNVACQ